MKNAFIKLATIGALAASMALAQTPAEPAPPHPGRMMARQGMHKRMVQALGLTDAQKQQAKAIFQQARLGAQPLAHQLRANREALAAAVKANDVAQIHSLSAQQGSLQGQLLGIRTEAMAKVYSILTPDQKTKADELRQKRRG